MDRKKTEIRKKRTSPPEGFGAAFSRYLGKYLIREQPDGGGTAKKREKIPLLPELTRVLNPVSKKRMKGIGVGILTFLVGGAALGTGQRPLGLAMAAASEGFAPYAYGGLALSALTAGGEALPTLFACFLSLALRLLYSRSGMTPAGQKDDPASCGSPKCFRESLPLRCGNSALCAGFCGMLRLILYGFRRAEVLTGLGSIAVAAAGVAAYQGVTRRELRYSPVYEAGIYAVLFSVLWGLRQIAFFGFSVACLLGVMLTLYISKTGGILRGGTAGLLCGLACGLVRGAAYAPAFGLMGLVAGIGWSRNVLFAMAGSGTAGVVYCLMAGGVSALGGIIPDIIGGTALMMPLIQFDLIPKLPLYSLNAALPEDRLAEAVVGELREKSGAARLEAMSAAFTDLSELFYRLSDRMHRPGVFQIRQMAERVWRRKCDVCKLNTACWHRDAGATADNLTHLSETMVKNGAVTASDVPEPLRSRCPHLKELTRELGQEEARMLEEAALRDRSELFAMDYEAMARLLDEAGKQNEAEYRQDPEKSRKARRAARMRGIGAQSIAVYGSRRVSVAAQGVELSRLSMTPEEVSALFGEACGMAMDPPEFAVDSDNVTMTLTRKRVLTLETAQATAKKEGESQNGDSCTGLTNREDYFYQILSDGMGSGKEAALTSRTALIFLEKLLMAGNRKSIALEMLNNFIRNRNMECFATVDLLEIDLLTGGAGFIKSGAAPSYVLREGKLFRISSSTLPIGITRQIKSEEIRFELEPGDIIVMMTDGVSAGLEDSVWLADLLSYGMDDTHGLQEMAQRILRGAQENNRRKDDCTVALIRVMAAE